jgi:hypothetical protein
VPFRSDTLSPFRASYLFCKLGARLGRRFQKPSQHHVHALLDLAVVASLITHRKEYTMADDAVPTLEEEQREFYEAVGRAITGWAELEDVLFQMTMVILGCSKERAAIVFYRTPTIDSRLTLTSDLINSFFPRHKAGEPLDPRIGSWRELQADIKEHLHTRNRLAHHQVGTIVQVYEDRSGGALFDLVHASYASPSELLRKPGQSLDPLTITDVQRHIEIISKLANRLRNFDRREVSRPNAKPEERGVPRTLRQDGQGMDR